MFLGLDLGTSGLRAVLVTADGQVAGRNMTSLKVPRTRAWPERLTATALGSWGGEQISSATSGVQSSSSPSQLVSRARSPCGVGVPS